MPTLPGRAATTRIVWIADDRDTLRLLRAPLLGGLIADGHKILMLAPGLNAVDRLALLTLGIESDELLVPAARAWRFSRLAARRQLMRILMAWNARIVVADGPAVLGLATDAARQAGIAHVCPVAPALTDAAGAQRVMRELRGQLPAFVSGAESGRQLAAWLPLAHGWQPALLPLTRLAAEPAVALPGLETGLVFCAIGGREIGPFAAAVALLDPRAGRARFQLVRGVDGAAGAAPAGRLDVIDESSENQAVAAAALRAAHVVVIDGTSARHQWALAEALRLGRPVLAIDTVVTRDLVDGGVCGWLVAPKAAALADAMTATLKRPDLLPAMAQAARQKAERRFGAAVVQAGLLQGLQLQGPAALARSA
jgi:Glycosyl transferases group 1